MNNDYYVYVFLRCDRPGSYKYDDVIFKYEPFYVGKGRRNKMITSLTTGNPVKLSIIKYLKKNKIPIIKMKICENLCENSALLEESLLIKKIGLYTEGGRLSNMTYGGDGASNISLYKPIYMFDINGLFEKKFESIEHASTTLSLLQPNITKCCYGERFTTGNKIFKFASDFDEQPKKICVEYLNNRKGCGPKERPVSQYDMSDNLINNYKSIKEASEKTGCQKSKIVLCCQGKRKHTSNYKWKYLNK